MQNTKRERGADAYTVTAVANLSGVSVRATDDGASWRARVYDVLPGVLDHISPSAEGRDAELDRVIAHFRREVRESRLRLIGTLLLCLVPPLIHLLLGMFGHPNPQFADLTDIYLKLSVIPLAAMIYFSLRLRGLYASAEEDPIWM